MSFAKFVDDCLRSAKCSRDLPESFLCDVVPVAPLCCIIAQYEEEFSEHDLEWAIWGRLIYFAPTFPYHDYNDTTLDNILIPLFERHENGFLREWISRVKDGFYVLFGISYWRCNRPGCYRRCCDCGDPIRFTKIIYENNLL